MATLQQKIQCEEDARELILQYGLPEPDDVEYGFTCIRLYWSEPKVVLVVDIDRLDQLPDEDLEASISALGDEEEGAT